MSMQDTLPIREKILKIIRRKGPSLPVHIANELNMSILFASAFLSELLSDKNIKISHMRVGSSPIYFIPGQEPGLEKYAQHLKSKEREAFFILKEKKFLKDETQLPAIRVALRAINDFAIPFKRGDDIFWRFFTTPESEFISKRSEQKISRGPLITKEEIKPLITSPQSVSAKPETESVISKPILQESKPEHHKTLNIFDDKPEEFERIEESKKIEKPIHLSEYTLKGTSPKLQGEGAKKKPTKKKATKKKVMVKKQDDRFFIKVKEFLTNKGIEISDIEGFSKNDLTLRVNIKGEEKLLIAHNKKRVEEIDIIKAHKKASDLNLHYLILSLGEPLKKLSNLIEAVKSLDGIEKIE